MAKYEELKDMLCEELDRITKKGELSPGSLDIVDKLTHSIKSIDTIVAMEDSGYSGTGYTYRRRDSMGRYSRDDAKAHFMAEVEELMEKAPDDHTRRKFEKFLAEMK